MPSTHEQTREEMGRTLQQVPSVLRQQLDQLGFAANARPDNPAIPLELMAQMLPGLFQQQQARGEDQRLAGLREELFNTGDIGSFLGQRGSVSGAHGIMGLRPEPDNSAQIAQISQDLFDGDLTPGQALRFLSPSKVKTIMELSGGPLSKALQDPNSSSESLSAAIVGSTKLAIDSKQIPSKLRIRIIGDKVPIVKQMFEDFEAVESPEEVRELIQIYRLKRDELPTQFQEFFDAYLEKNKGPTFNDPDKSDFQQFGSDLGHTLLAPFFEPRQEQTFQIEQFSGQPPEDQSVPGGFNQLLELFQKPEQFTGPPSPDNEISEQLRKEFEALMGLQDFSRAGRRTLETKRNELERSRE